MSYMNYNQPSYRGMRGHPPALPPRNTNLPSDASYGSPTQSNTAPSLAIDENEAFAVVQSMEKDDLNILLMDNTKVDNLIESLTQVKNIQQEREMMLTSNKSLAEYNLEIRPQFEELKQAIARNYAEISQLKTKLAEDIGNMDAVVNNQSLDTILALIQADAASSEEETEQLAQNFLDKKTETEAFLEEYIPKRMQAHLKKVRVEKMSDLIKNRCASNAAPSVHHTSTGSPSLQRSNYNWNEPTNCPYPTGGTPFMRIPEPANYF